MREILFRGKIPDIIDWVYGYYAKSGDNHFILFDTDSEDNFSIVYPETVGQYTGLTDKNGKKIFEGDIVHCWDTIAKCEIWVVVEFGNPNAKYNWGWQLRKIKGSKGVNLDILCWVECEETNTYCEVIGNIHDNSELLQEDMK